MQIADYKDLISELPFMCQSTNIKKRDWSGIINNGLIQGIFGDNNEITLNRTDLFNINPTENNNFKIFVIKTLMWGFPTSGRGRNISNLLEENNFNNLIVILQEYDQGNIQLNQLSLNIDHINGLGLSTMSKFTYFLSTKINDYRSIILDLRIINVIRSERFEELNDLNIINYSNAINKYVEFLELIHNLSGDLEVEPDQIELFLFLFGNTLYNNNQQ